MPVLWKACGRPCDLGLRGSDIDFTKYRRSARYIFRVSALLSRFVDTVIANSRVGAEFHVKHGYTKANMTVIPNGVDADRFLPDSEARRRLRGEWSIADNELLVGIVGRVDPQKDYITFVQAVAAARRLNLTARFVAVGATSSVMRGYHDEVSALARKIDVYDQVIWVGVRNDMHDVYNALDLLTLSSAFGEGFPNVVGEAMATGVPCVVTDTGDSAWVVGDRGIVVEPGKPEALAEAWAHELAKPLTAERRKWVRSRITENFAVSRLVSDTSAFLRIR